jgi:hypothetical protein
LNLERCILSEVKISYMNESLKTSEIAVTREELVSQFGDFLDELSEQGETMASLSELASRTPVLKASVDYLINEGLHGAAVYAKRPLIEMQQILGITIEELNGLSDYELSHEEQRQRFLEALAKSNRRDVLEAQSYHTQNIDRLRSLAKLAPDSSAANRAQGLQEMLAKLPQLLEAGHPTALEIIRKDISELSQVIETATKYAELLAKLSPDLELSFKDVFMDAIRRKDENANALPVAAATLASGLPNLQNVDSGTVSNIVRHDTIKKVIRGTFLELILNPSQDGVGFDPLAEDEPMLSYIMKDEDRPIYDLSVREYIDDTLDVIGYYIAYLKCAFDSTLAVGEFKSVFNAEQASQIIEGEDQESNEPIQFHSKLGFTSTSTACLNALREHALLRKAGSDLGKYQIQIKKVTDPKEIPTNAEGTVELFSGRPSNPSDYKYQTVLVSNLTTPERANSFHTILQGYKIEIASGEENVSAVNGLKLIGLSMADYEGKGDLRVQLTNIEIEGQPAVRVDTYITYPIDNVFAEAETLAKQAERRAAEQSQNLGELAA